MALADGSAIALLACLLQMSSRIAGTHRKAHEFVREAAELLELARQEAKARD